MEKQDLLSFLNRLLANYFVLHTKMYRYQWYAKGPHVLNTKATFASLQPRWQKDLEKIAQHILYLNGKPFATMVKFIKETTLKEAEADDLEEEVFLQFQKDLQQINEEIIKEGIPLAEKLKDYLTLFFLLQLQLNISEILHQFQDLSFE